jgi:hypothetical protein
MGEALIRLSGKLGLSQRVFIPSHKRVRNGKVEDVDEHFRVINTIADLSPEELKAVKAQKGGPSFKAREGLRAKGEQNAEVLARMKANAKKNMVESPGVKAKREAAERAKPGDFLGHDPDGNEVKVGSSIKIVAGPDKGSSGTVSGPPKIGAGVLVEIKGLLGKKRTAAVDYDELRVKRRAS